MNTPESPALSSLWDGLSGHLLASFYEVAKLGEGGDAAWGRIDGKTDPTTVYAPLSEANLEMALNWQSPFEQAGVESRAPALMAMLQSGALQPVVSTIFGHHGDESEDSITGGFGAKVGAMLSRFEGRTGMTKLNSTQVFTGMPPVKIQVTALFRAWRDARSEVDTPYNKLMQWALPIGLSKDGSILARAVQAVRGEMDWVDALMPSYAPTRIGMTYKRRTYAPLVIEAIGLPMSSPVNANGEYIELSVPLTLCTLTALDRADWVNAQQQSM